MCFLFHFSICLAFHLFYFVPILVVFFCDFGFTHPTIIRSRFMPPQTIILENRRATTVSSRYLSMRGATRSPEVFWRPTALPTPPAQLLRPRLASTHFRFSFAPHISCLHFQDYFFKRCINYFGILYGLVYSYRHITIICMCRYVEPVTV